MARVLHRRETAARDGGARAQIVLQPGLAEIGLQDQAVVAGAEMMPS